MGRASFKAKRESAPPKPVAKQQDAKKVSPSKHDGRKNYGSK